MSLATLREPAPFPDIRPDSVAAVRRSGRWPHRVLMFGGGALGGAGLHDHNQGLPGHLADELVRRSGRGADIDVIVDGRPTSARALDGLRGLRLRRYDAVVIFLGDRPVHLGINTDRWSQEVEGLLRTVRDEVHPSVPVILCDTTRAMLQANTEVSRRIGARADRLTTISADAAEETGVSFIDLTTNTVKTTSFRVSSTTYGIWADVIASRLYNKLLALEDPTSQDCPAQFRTRADPERQRQQALIQMRLAPGARNPMLDFVVAQTRKAFGTRYAHLNIIDGDFQRAYASTAPEPAVVPREFAFCDHTIRTDKLTLVNDSHRDFRFYDNPLVIGDDPIRFYAGYPIHSWDGYRIGALCIIDNAPRNMLPSDLTTLRDFAGRIEQELWSAALHDRSLPAGAARPGLWI